MHWEKGGKIYKNTKTKRNDCFLKIGSILFVFVSKIHFDLNIALKKPHL
jgi:hypothetical protein